MEKDHTIPIDEERVYAKVTVDQKEFTAKKPPYPIMKPFDPFRVVVNFKLVDSKGEVVTEFDPAFELWVQLTRDDELKAAERDRTPQLAYWNGDHWVRFKEGEHNFRIGEDPNGNKYGIADISKWPDPPIAWGT